MNKIYHVIIRGKTLESRDLKELLARAVSTKRKLDRKAQIQARFHPHASVQNVSNPNNQARRAAML
jgi:hypothetical protein